MVGRLVLPTLTLLTIMVILSGTAWAGTDDYPDAWRLVPQDSKVDDWGFYSRECTSFVAWRLHDRNHFEMPLPSGTHGAADWGVPTHNGGFVPDHTPAVGAVAWWAGAAWNGGNGHVAWVESVNSNDTVTIEEYNFDYEGHYHERTIDSSSADGFIHFADLGAGTTSNGNSSLDLAGYFHGIPPDGAVIENHDGGLHKYVALHGSLIWIPPDTIWGYVEQMHRLIPADSRFHEIVWMHDSDIHSIEYGFGGDRVHVPGDNAFFYEDGSTQQYVVQYGYAFGIANTDEVAFLGGVNKAVMVPPGLAARLGGTPDIPNDVLLQTLFDPAIYHVVNGSAFWADNTTVVDCIEKVKGGAIQPVPASLMTSWRLANRVHSEVTHCSFPPNWALYGPGGAERWRIDGANPYSRHHYISPLALHCRLGSQPAEVQLPDAAGVNQPTEGEPFGCPDNSFVRIIGNGEVFRVDGEILHYVPSPATLTCLTWGNDGVVADVDGAVVATTPRGNPLSCQFEGRMLQAPNGQVDYVQNGARHHVLNAAIVNCLIGRSGTGDPVRVS